MNNRNDILNELQEISPLLLGIKQSERKPGVPEGYFEHLDDEILSVVKEPDMTVLSAFDKTKVVAVPSQYFENFADQLMQKIHQQETEASPGKIIPLLQKTSFIYLKRIAFAASIIGIVFLGIRLYNKPVNDECDQIACLTRDEIRQYVNENIDEFEAEQINEAFQPVYETVSNTVLPEDETADIQLDEKEIERYNQQNPSPMNFDEASTDIF